MKEQFRIKVYGDKLVAGLIGRNLFNSYDKYPLFLETLPHIALTLGFPFLSESLRDGGGDTHTQVYRRIPND